MKKELTSLNEINNEISQFCDKLRDQEHNYSNSEIKKDRLYEKLNKLTDKRDGESKKQEYTAKISELEIKMVDSKSGINDLLSNLRRIFQDLEYHDTSTEAFGSLMLEDINGSYIKTQENLSIGSEEIQRKILELKNKINEIQEEYSRKRASVIQGINNRRVKVQKIENFKEKAGSILRGVSKVLKTTGKIAFKGAMIATSIALRVVSGVVSLLSRGAGLIGRSVSKGMWQSGIFKRTGPGIGKVKFESQNGINSFNPGPEAAASFRSMFGKPEISPVGGYAGHSHFGYDNPLHPDSKNPGWHITTEIPKLKQGEKIVIHDFVNDFDFKPNHTNSTKIKTVTYPENPISAKNQKRNVYYINDIIAEKESLKWTKKLSKIKREQDEQLWRDYYKNKHTSVQPAHPKYESWSDKQKAFEKLYKIRKYNYMDSGHNYLDSNNKINSYNLYFNESQDYWGKYYNKNRYY